MATINHVFAEIDGATLAGTYDDVTLNLSLVTLDATNALGGVGFSVSQNNVVVGTATAQPGQVKTWTVPAGSITLVAVTGVGGRTGIRLPDGVTLAAWTL